MVCGFVSSFMIKEWMIVGSLLKKGSFVFGVWLLIIGGKIVEKFEDVE